MSKQRRLSYVNMVNYFNKFEFPSANATTKKVEWLVNYFYRKYFKDKENDFKTNEDRNTKDTRIELERHSVERIPPPG